MLALISYVLPVRFRRFMGGRLRGPNGPEIGEILRRESVSAKKLATLAEPEWTHDGNGHHSPPEAPPSEIQMRLQPRG